MPAGRPEIAVSSTAPTESPREAASSISGHARAGFRVQHGEGGESSAARSTSSASQLKSRSQMLWQDLMCVPMRMPWSESICSKIAPAATSPVVTRPEKCPPPRAS